MKEVVLAREPSTDEGTFGTMAVDGKVFFSLELPWRDNRRRRSCIPTGGYVCKLVRSPRFGQAFTVTGVPGRSAILIHPGNFGGDVEKGWQSHVEGCILLGLRRGKMTNISGRPQRCIFLSRPAVREFMELVGSGPFLLLVKEQE